MTAAAKILKWLSSRPDWQQESAIQTVLLQAEVLSAK